MVSICKRLMTDENGAELFDYTLVMGLITLLALALMSAAGQKLNLRWVGIKNAMDGKS